MGPHFSNPAGESLAREIPFDILRAGFHYILSFVLAMVFGYIKGSQHLLAQRALFLLVFASIKYFQFGLSGFLQYFVIDGPIDNYARVLAIDTLPEFFYGLTFLLLHNPSTGMSYIRSGFQSVNLATAVLGTLGFAAALLLLPDSNTPQTVYRASEGSMTELDLAEMWSFK